jgi:hypothetical protein
MKVENMTSSKGNKVANQFIIYGDPDPQGMRVRTFQSYGSVIVREIRQNNTVITVELDETYWDYSVTTGKYRNQFLGETKAETQKKIDSGEYTLADLNP